jgi:PAS domain S-box-containing protein
MTDHATHPVSSLQESIPIPEGSPVPQSFLDCVPICILVVDEELRICNHNKKATQLFRDPDRMIGHFIWKLCYNDTDIGTLRMYLATGSEHPLSLVLKGREKQPVHTKIYVTRLEGQRILFLENNTEAVLLDSELRNLKTAVQFAADAIFLFDEQGMIFFTNPALEQQVGLQSENIIGKNIREFWSDHVPSVVFKDFWDNLKRNQTWAGELICIRRGGAVFDVEVRVRPIYSETRMFVAFVCVQRDITERKELEDQIAAYSNNLQHLVEERTQALEKLHDISMLFHHADTLDKRLRLVLIAATAGETFGFNRAFLLLFNKSMDALLGRIAIGPSSPEEAGRLWNQVKQMPDDGTFIGRLEAYLSHSDKKDEQVNYIVSQLATPLDNKSSILVKAVTLDQSFIIQDGQADVDFDRNIFNTLGTNSFAVIPLVGRELHIGVLIVDNVITQKPITVEDLQMLDILATQAALAIAHANMVEELAHKVEETKFAYDQLRLSQKQLIEKNKFAALGQMAATVAHEIRTPLVSIGGFATRLRSKFAEHPDPKISHYLDIICSESIRLEDVLNRLLFYARPSLPNKSKQDFREFLESILAFMSDELENSKISLQINHAGYMPDVSIDRNLIRQVIINLVQNSVQSMEKGGTLYITTVSENDQWLKLDIQDTGVGISEEYLDKIYEPFFSTKHSGTGLGLHVSQRIIESHHGTIHIASCVGKGTRVTIRLPLHEEDI